MHSSRMRTARSSGRPGGVLHQAHPTPGAEPPESRHPPKTDTPWEQTPPGADTPLLTESQTPVKI